MKHAVFSVVSALLLLGSSPLPGADADAYADDLQSVLRFRELMAGALELEGPGAAALNEVVYLPPDFLVNAPAGTTAVPGFFERLTAKTTQYFPASLYRKGVRTA